MAIYYADSSVLVKRHVNEIGSTWFQTLVGAAAENEIITSQVSLVEVYSALNRRSRELLLVSMIIFRSLMTLLLSALRSTPLWN